MMTRDDIFFEAGRLCLHLADDLGALKGFEVPKNKQSALLYHNGQMLEVNWIGVQNKGDMCYLAFYENDLITELPSPLSELAYSLRPYCFDILRRLSHALENADGKLYTNLDSIPLSNAWVFPNGDILLLTSQLGDIVDRFSVDALRHSDKEIWYAHNCVNGFGKAHFLFQLLYYSLTGKVPFEAPEVRENNFKAVPMALLFPPKSEDDPFIGLCKDIDLALSDNRKFQFGIKKPYAYFRGILDKYAELDVSSIQPGTNPALSGYWAKVSKRAKVKAFLRTKGFRTFLIVLGALAVAGIIAFYVWRAVKPPLTKDLNEVEIIEYYYDAVNNLDVAAMDEPMKNGYDGPDLMTVTTLHVSKTMQISYEGKSHFIEASTWIENGMPDVEYGTTIYGITEVSVEQISDDVFRATVILWTSDNIVDETNSVVADAGIEVYKTQETVDFTFQTRGTWREIAKMEVVDSQVLQQIHVNFIQAQTQTP